MVLEGRFYYVHDSSKFNVLVLSLICTTAVAGGARFTAPSSLVRVRVKSSTLSMASSILTLYIRHITFMGAKVGVKVKGLES